MAFRLDDGEEIDVASLSNPATSGALAGGGLNATFCNTTITPTCLRELYNIGKFQGSLKNGNLLGICGYLEEYAKYADLEQFVTTYTPEEDPAIANFTFVLINGGLSTQNDTVDDDVEANCECDIILCSSIHDSLYSWQPIILHLSWSMLLSLRWILFFV